MSTAAVEAEGVERRFPGGRGVGPLSLRVETGESLALMGHNGAGKTTLLRLLATADRPGRGELRWNGDRSPHAARRSLGLALDRVDEEPCLSGRQAAYFWCRRWIGDRDRAQRLVDAALRRFGLGEVADEPVGAYSFGMRRRLGLVEALAHEPAVAFLAAGLLAGGGTPSALLAGGEAARVAELTLDGRVDPGAFARVPGVESATAVEGGVRVRFTDPAALPALVAAADTPAGALRALRVRRPDLGDRFAELTGRTLEAGE